MHCSHIHCSHAVAAVIHCTISYKCTKKIKVKDKTKTRSVHRAAAQAAGGGGRAHGGDGLPQAELHVRALLDAAAFLYQPIGQRRLAVVDMRDDREIADMGEVCHGARNIGAQARRGKRREGLGREISVRFISSGFLVF